jgi:putative transcriptional regulator
VDSSVTGFGEEGRPIDTLLAAYASGRVSRALAVLVESHLALRPENRRFVADLESLQGRSIEEIEPRPLERRAERIAAIVSQKSSANEGAPVVEPVLPAPLRAYLGHGLEAVRWRWLLPGLSECRLSGEGVSLLRAKAGTKLPNHTHRGAEVTLVLKGVFRDKTGRYARGDIEIGEESLDHRPVVEMGEDCICFVVDDAPPKLTGRFGRWLEKLQTWRS